MSRTLHIYDKFYIPFLFPQHLVVDTPYKVSSTRSCILELSRDLRIPGYIQDYKDLIVLYPYSKLGLDIRIVDRNTLIDFISVSRGMPKLKKLDSYSQSFNENLFRHFIVFSLVMRKWVVEREERNVKVYNLFQALFESKAKFLLTFFELRKSVSFPELWSAILTFLIKSKYYETQKDVLSPFYAQLVKSMAQQGSFRRFADIFKQENFSEFIMLDTLLSIRQ